jgi:hypothetical protein
VAALAEAPSPAPPALEGQVAAEAAQAASGYNTTGEMIKGRMPDLVKGAGFAPKGGNQPLDNQTDILTRSSQAALDLRMATHQGFHDKSNVVKSLNQGWLNERGALKTALTMPSIGDQVNQQLQSFFAQVATPDVARSFTAGNLGISGAVYGNTPFNLLAPSRLG